VLPALLLSPAGTTAAQPADSLSKVHVSIEVSPKSVAPGGTAVAAVIMDHDPGWHSWTNPGNNPQGTAVFDGAIRTNISTAMPTNDILVHTKDIQWPKAHVVKADVGEGPQEYAVLTEKAVIFVPLTIRTGTINPGTYKIDLKISFQSCDDKTCL